MRLIGVEARVNFSSRTTLYRKKRIVIVITDRKRLFLRFAAMYQMQFERWAIIKILLIYRVDINNVVSAKEMQTTLKNSKISIDFEFAPLTLTNI